MLNRAFNDPLRSALVGRATFHGHKNIGDEPFIPISRAEREMILQRLTREEKDIVCEGCGSTKPLTYFQAIGAISCCPDRKMVPAADLLADRDHFRSIAPAQPCEQAAGVLFGNPVSPYSRGVAHEGISARLMHNCDKSGIRLVLNFTKRLATHITTPRVEARYGLGTDTDKLLLTFGDRGSFQFCRDQKSRRFYVSIRPPESLPNKPATTRKCDFGWRDVGKEMVITLPINAWISTQ